MVEIEYISEAADRLWSEYYTVKEATDRIALLREVDLISKEENDDCYEYELIDIIYQVDSNTVQVWLTKMS